MRRSQRHSGQNPVKSSSGCLSQLKEERGGCGGGSGGGCVGSAVVGFIPGGNVQCCALCSCSANQRKRVKYTVRICEEALSTLNNGEK